MKIYKILPILTFLIYILSCNKIYNYKLNKTSWFSNDSFSEKSLSFYKNSDDSQKAIIQFFGSGIPVIYSIIYDVTILDNNIILKNPIIIGRKNYYDKEVYNYINLKIKKNYIIDNTNNIKYFLKYNNFNIITWKENKADIKILENEEFNTAFFYNN